MALFDNAGLFSEDQAVTATAASTNSIDLGLMKTPVGAAGALVLDAGLSEIPILVQVTTTFATLTSLVVSVEMDDNSSFSSPTTVARSEVIPAASLVAGYKFRLPCMIPEGTTERYVQLRYTVGGSNATAGKIFAGIVASRPGAV